MNSVDPGVPNVKAELTYWPQLQATGVGTYRLDAFHKTYNSFCNTSSPPFYLSNGTPFAGNAHVTLTAERPTISSSNAPYWLGPGIRDSGFYSSYTQVTSVPKGALE